MLGEIGAFRLPEMHSNLDAVTKRGIEEHLSTTQDAALLGNTE